MQRTIKTTICLLSIISARAHLTHNREEEDTDSQAGRQFTNLYRDNLEQMLRLSDVNVAPCQDFFQHACGNWNKKPTSEESEAAIADEVPGPPPFLYNHEDRMHFFAESRQRFDTRPGVMLRDLYNDCKDRSRYDVVRGLELQPQWQRMLQEIPFLRRNAASYEQWPYLRHQWTELNRNIELNWVTLAAEFAAHGIPSFLNIFFAAGTIYIAPLDDLKCPSLQEFRASLRPLLAEQRNPQIALIVGRELSVLCRQLSGELPLSGEVDAFSGNNSGASLLIDEMASGYFQTYFSTLNFTAAEIESARKIPIDMPRLEEGLTVMRNTEPRIVFNFVLWRAHEQLKYEDCFLLTEEFELLLQSEYWQWSVFEPYFRRDVALAMYLFHTTRFQRQRKSTLLSEEWERFLQVPLERKDLNIERAILTYANTFFDAQNISLIYGALPWQFEAFYANLLSLRRLRLRQSFLEPATDAEDVNQPAYFLRQFLNFCIVLLKQPLFHYYATQGLQLWHDSDILYSSDGFYTAQDCLDRQSILHFDDAAFYRFLSPPEVSSCFRFYSSFVAAFRDYKFWLEGESFAFAEDFVLEYFQMNSSRILFYAVAQQYCGRNDAVYRLQINRSFLNMPEFQAAFNCSADAPLNPIVKCMIRNCDI